jgi:hypothetical protein
MAWAGLELSLSKQKQITAKHSELCVVQLLSKYSGTYSFGSIMYFKDKNYKF